MKSTGMAYLLCAVGLVSPVHGLHRFYLGKPVSGFFYLITFGFFWIGTIIDLFKIPDMVENHNLKWQLRQGSPVNINIHGQPGQSISVDYPSYAASQQPTRESTPRREPQPPPLDPEKALENIILQLARKFRGKLTPLELAANSALSIDEANKSLENFVRKGYADMTVTDEGNILYEFPGLLQFEPVHRRELHDQDEHENHRDA